MKNYKPVKHKKKFGFATECTRTSAMLGNKL